MITLVFEKLSFFWNSPYFCGGLNTFRNLGFHKIQPKGQDFEYLLGFWHFFSLAPLSLCFLHPFLSQPGS